MNASSPSRGCDWWNWAENSSPCTSALSHLLFKFYNESPPCTPRLWKKRDKEEAFRKGSRCYIGTGTGKEEGAGGSVSEVQCQRPCVSLQWKAKAGSAGSICNRKNGHPGTRFFWLLAVILVMPFSWTHVPCLPTMCQLHPKPALYWFFFFLPRKAMPVLLTFLYSYNMCTEKILWD